MIPLRGYGIFALSLIEADRMIRNYLEDNFRHLQQRILLVCKQRLWPNQYHLRDILLQEAAAAAVIVVVVGKGM